MDDKLQAFTLQEVADALKVSLRSMQNYVKYEQIRAFKVGNRWRVSATELEYILTNGLREKKKN